MSIKSSIFISAAILALVSGGAWAAQEAAAPEAEAAVEQAEPAAQQAAPAVEAPRADEAPPASGAPSAVETPRAVEAAPAKPPLAAALAEALGAPSKAFGSAARREAATLVEFYAARGHEPLWIAEGRFSDSARALIGRIARAAEDGLEPSDFALPNADLQSGDDKALADADLALSAAIVLYARQAQSGRIDPSRVSALVTVKPERPNAVESLKQVALAADPVARLDAFHPAHEAFRRLRDKLAELRGQATSESSVKVPLGPTLKRDMRDERVALLRRRLNVPDGDEPALYDESVETAVKAFQKSRNARATGIVARDTLAALNAPAPNRVAEAVINMERWRWMPRDLGRRHVFVNVPEYMVRVNVDGADTYTGRVVVGKTENQTPIFSNKISYVVVNPYWNVPRSILMKEMMPQIRSDPGSLARRGYQFVSNSGKVVDPYSIDWSRVSDNYVPFRIRQNPGEANALGRVKFMFPNEHSVYLHDTPARSLFSREMRAFSHGCVRVHEPFKFADALLADESDLDARRLQGMIGGPEKTAHLKTAVPVHIAYFTAFVNKDGALERRADIYGHDRRLRELMGLGAGPAVASRSAEAAVASAEETPVQPAPRRSSRRKPAVEAASWDRVRRRRDAEAQRYARRPTNFWGLPAYDADYFARR